MVAPNINLNSGIKTSPVFSQNTINNELEREACVHGTASCAWGVGTCLEVGEGIEEVDTGVSKNLKKGHMFKNGQSCSL